MTVRNLATLVAFAITSILASGCSLEAAVVNCAQCGEIRAIAPRPASRDIGLPSDAPHAMYAGAEMVYYVRVRMDRGGSRDFVLPSRDGLRVGDRVELRDDKLVPVSRVAGLGLT